MLPSNLNPPTWRKKRWCVIREHTIKSGFQYFIPESELLYIWFFILTSGLNFSVGISEGPCMLLCREKHTCSPLSPHEEMNWCVVKVWCGSSCYLKVFPISGRLILIKWDCFGSSLQAEGDFLLHFAEISSSEESLVSLNALPSTMASGRKEGERSSSSCMPLHLQV